MPTDYTNTDCTVMFVEYDFRVVMQPCIVNTYTDTQQVGDITYNIGAPGLFNVGAYIFDEDPVCNYPETVTITPDLPFLDHNLATSDFNLPQTADLSLIGSYPVQIRSEIQVPTDEFSTAFTTMFVEYTFTVFIEPCLVTTYEATLEVADIYYNIASPAQLNVSPYVFDETPVCNYPETVTLTGM